MVSRLHPMAPRLLRYSVLLAVLLGAGVLMAQSPSRIRPPRSLVTVSLEDESGERLRTYSARGQTFVLGRHGQRYNVRVQNQGPERVEIVLAVDGRDAVSGQTTDLVRHRGYVIPAYGSVLVQGFRTSMEGVASFRFTDPGDAYTSRMGTPQNVGMIQVAVFDERARDPRPIALPDDDWRFDRRTWRDRQWGPPSGGEPPATASRPGRPGPAEPGAAAEAGAKRAARPDVYRPMPADEGSNLGTEFGEHRYSRVVEVDFERATPSRPSQWITVRYDDEQGLLARGIEIYPRPVYATPPPPPPWPPTYEPTRFAPPPPTRHRPWYSGWDW